MLSKNKERRTFGWTRTFLSALLLFTTLAANAEPFERTSSGWVISTAVDLNGNGRPMNINTTFGKGKFVSSTVVMRFNNGDLLEEKSTSWTTTSAMLIR